jgi:hypothetical protein
MSNLKLRGALVAASLAAGICNAGYQGTFSGTAEAIADPYCYAASFYPWFTTGGQYVEPNNGVVNGVHSMLARWQGDDILANYVSYDMGRWTGVHVNNQRGYQPENAASATPGAAVSCYNFGMLLNSRWNPHRPVVGGGYNDMYGYSWAGGSRTRPFVKDGQPTHLMLQGNVGVSTYAPVNTSGVSDPSAASGQVGFFAYLRDTTHPSLPPIAILAMTHLNGTVGSTWGAGDAAFDYTNYDTTRAATAYPNWLAGQTGDGVWFGAGPIMATAGNQSAFVSTYYTEGQTTGFGPMDLNGSPPMPFFRAHIRPQDWVNLVTAIQSHPCVAPRGCPPRGYSLNAADYELEYAGLIAETTLIRDNFDGNNLVPVSNFDTSASSWVPNDTTKPQVTLGVAGYGFGIYRAIPTP